MHEMFKSEITQLTNLYKTKGGVSIRPFLGAVMDLAETLICSPVTSNPIYLIMKNKTNTQRFPFYAASKGRAHIWGQMKMSVTEK